MNSQLFQENTVGNFTKIPESNTYSLSLIYEWVILSQEIKLVRQDQPFIIPCCLLLITQLSYMCLVMLCNSHLPQNGSLNIKCLAVNHICFLLQLVGRHRQNFLSFLSVYYKETVYWSDLDI